MIRDNQELMKRIDLGVREGAAKALAQHKREGYPIAVWKDEKIVIIPPEEIQVPQWWIDSQK